MSSPSGGEGFDAGAGYLVPAQSGRGELREKGSRFLALLVPVGNEQQAGEELERARNAYRDATHHCWAWRLGAAGHERSSDDREPAGTAGKPILQVLRGGGLSDVLLVVVRWFGGKKLGRAALARAYAAAARAALDGVRLVERVEKMRLEITLPYKRLGALKRLLEVPGRRLCSESYDEAVAVVVEVERPLLRTFEEALADLGPGVKARPARSTSG